MKTTNLEEMRIAMETYYEEVRASRPGWGALAARGAGAGEGERLELGSATWRSLSEAGLPRAHFVFSAFSLGVYRFIVSRLSWRVQKRQERSMTPCLEPCLMCCLHAKPPSERHAPCMEPAGPGLALEHPAPAPVLLVVRG